MDNNEKKRKTYEFFILLYNRIYIYLKVYLFLAMTERWTVSYIYIYILKENIKKWYRLNRKQLNLNVYIYI